MFAVFRLLPPQGGESVAPYQAFGAHPLMQIMETLHIKHYSKSPHTNITPFSQLYKRILQIQQMIQKPPRLPVTETGAVHLHYLCFFKRSRNHLRGFLIAAWAGAKITERSQQ